MISLSQLKQQQREAFEEKFSQHFGYWEGPGAQELEDMLAFLDAAIDAAALATRDAIVPDKDKAEFEGEAKLWNDARAAMLTAYQEFIKE